MNKNLMLVICLCFVINVYCVEEKVKSWKDKSILDMNDADMERLFDQWEIDASDPDNLLRMTKVGKSIMMFVDLKKDLTDSEADNIFRLWQGSLQNNHIIAERYPIEPKRAVFMFREGSQAVDAKNFLIDQPELEHVTLEGQIYPGKHSAQKKEKTEL
ncbi:Similar to boca: LDLR chaperone boca (Drosophila melanogaster) [Cotesia congregata]|uniref:Similar to boca: LDLR chaperone boca (Drosophila melanogaster) n=1 Tax=Cotesia congregata TaxID=51543 RepID=A0A8J2MSF2_COTCN|nr:Similar to boca: LDLR chaperone boca (Drosophila melanogaster) [Cotesia congregata]